MIKNEIITENNNLVKRIYLAGPLFNHMEKNFNLKVAKILEENGYTVFLPQRDGYEAASLNGKTELQKIDFIFKKDISEIDKAEIIVMILDGRVPDEGACVELGYAYAKGKRCYGIKTDVRAIEIDMELNPLVAGCFKKIFKGENAEKEFIDFLSHNPL